MFRQLIEWWKTPQHVRMQRKSLKQARKDLVRAEECREYYAMHCGVLATRIKRIEKELKK